MRRRWGPCTSIDVSTSGNREYVGVAHRECGLECWVKIDCLLHRVIVQLVRKHDSPGSIEVASGLIVDEQLVVCIDVGGGDVVRSDAPIVRVELPYDRLQVQSVGDSTNAVLHPNSMSVPCPTR